MKNLIFVLSLFIGMNAHGSTTCQNFDGQSYRSFEIESRLEFKFGNEAEFKEYLGTTTIGTKFPELMDDFSFKDCQSAFDMARISDSKSGKELVILFSTEGDCDGDTTFGTVYEFTEDIFLLEQVGVIDDSQIQCF